MVYDIIASKFKGNYSNVCVCVCTHGKETFITCVNGMICIYTWMESHICVSAPVERWWCMILLPVNLKEIAAVTHGKETLIT